jgi:hypothetical protein
MGIPIDPENSVLLGLTHNNHLAYNHHMNTDAKPERRRRAWRLRDDAKAFIRSALKDGPIAATVILAEGARRGYSRSTMMSAKRELACEVRSLPIPGGRSNRWEWRLVPNPQTETPILSNVTK